MLAVFVLTRALRRRAVRGSGPVKPGVLPGNA